MTALQLGRTSGTEKRGELFRGAREVGRGKERKPVPGKFRGGGESFGKAGKKKRCLAPEARKDLNNRSDDIIGARRGGRKPSV